VSKCEKIIKYIMVSPTVEFTGFTERVKRYKTHFTHGVKALGNPYSHCISETLIDVSESMRDTLLTPVVDRSPKALPFA
jgi:hypothetical protein